jgi:tripartite-type tricarboxylate transporter receptor subunit TctC
MKGILRAFAAAVISSVISAAAPAQDSWPAKPVRLVVPSSPGGGTDLYARILAQALGDALKQQFVVDNRPGASGNIGGAAAAKSAPDGYTFLISANPAITINPSLYKNLPYNAERDFTPVTRGVIGPLVNAEIGRAMRTPAVAEKLNAQALVPVFDTPEEFAPR